MYSYDYNPKAGISAAIVVSEYDNSNNVKDPSRTFIMMKKDGEKNWITIEETLEVKNYLYNSKIKVYDNGIIAFRNEFPLWNSSKGKFDLATLQAYATDQGENWSSSFTTWQSQTFYSKENTIYKIFMDQLNLSFDLGKYFYRVLLPNKNREYNTYVYYQFFAISDSGVAFPN